MAQKTAFFLFFILHSFVGQTQGKKNYFKLIFTNNSQHTTTCSIPGNDKTDSVNAKQKKTITFEIESSQISFYVDIYTNDTSKASYQSKRIRVLTATIPRHITITEDNQLKYTLTPSEKIIANFNPQFRSKNFWKLDTVINNNSNNIAAADIIFIAICDIDVKVDTIKKYFNLLSPAIKSSKYGKRITNYLAARNRLKIGNKIESFGLPDTTGKVVRLNDIKSDYILLDFWFSRCTPCVESFPELQSLYAATSRNKFETIGISVDRNSETDLWKSTVEKYKLPWINLHDSKLTIISSLAIVYYPTKILLDKNRKIILLDTDNSYKNFYTEVEKLVNSK